MKKPVKQSREKIAVVSEKRLEQVKGASGYMVAWGFTDDPDQKPDGGQ